MKILSKLDNTGMIEEVADKRYVTDAEKLTWNSKADKTYVDSQDALKADKTYVDGKVQTDVPSGAVFTDTITTINSKTGAISKADIVALGIPSQDTVYSHPSTHPASMITESSTKRFVSDSEKSTWNSKSDTDTVTTINGKTGVISKDDIVALGIPAQDTVYTHPTGTNPHGTTKSDVGLGNVDNVKQASETEFDDHLEDGMAHGIGNKNTLLTTNKSTLVGAMNELFTNVSSGKQLVGGAITGVDDSIVIPADPTFQQLADAIGGISTGVKTASGTYTHRGTGSQGSIRGLSFIPSVVVSVCPSDSTARAFRWRFAPGETAYSGTYTRVDLIEGVYGFDWQHIGSLNGYETFSWLAIE